MKIPMNSPNVCCLNPIVKMSPSTRLAQTGGPSEHFAVGPQHSTAQDAAGHVLRLRGRVDHVRPRERRPCRARAILRNWKLIATKSLEMRKFVNGGFSGIFPSGSWIFLGVNLG